LVACGAEPRITDGPALPKPRLLDLAGGFERDGFVFLRYLRAADR
jgi:hypothetical protein